MMPPDTAPSVTAPLPTLTKLPLLSPLQQAQQQKTQLPPPTSYGSGTDPALLGAGQPYGGVPSQ